MSMQRGGAAVDQTVYPADEPLGEDILQRYICELLRPLVERWLDDPSVFVGADQFIYYQQFDPGKRYAPDVYVMPGVPRGTWIGAWKTWEDYAPPSFAFEVVSQDWKKDYVEVPRRCEIIGVAELVILDPEHRRRRARPGAKWQVFRRTEAGFELVTRTDDARVWSEALGCWLVAVGDGQELRVRLATGPDGLTIVPTAEEAERAAKEAAVAARDHALARIAELEAENRRLRGEPRDD
jgi:Uma2 family endonuclease